jgi:hypothetical protein
MIGERNKQSMGRTDGLNQLVEYIIMFPKASAYRISASYNNIPAVSAKLGAKQFCSIPT